MIARLAATTAYFFLFLFLLSVVLFSCRKEEDAFVFPVPPYEPPPPPATGADTVISVTARLNNDAFSALGRAQTPGKAGLEFSFLTTDGNALFVVLGADTPGVYEMKRSISAHTAVYYKKDLTETKSFTSRATDDAGGVFTVTAVDTVGHRIKGTFQLLLASRTYPETYDFKEGAFDILYNFTELERNGKKILAKEQAPSNFNQGTAAEPILDNISFTFPDNSTFTVSAGKYAGLKTYACNVIYKNELGKIYTAANAAMALQRYNYGQFLQAALGPVELTSDDGDKLTITEVRFVQGNTK